MPRSRHIIRAELKKQILDRIKQGEVSIPQIAAEHGISPKTIYNWLGKGVTAPPSVLELAKLKRENRSLKELLGQLTFELSREKKKEAHYR
jgi:transposase-like protein